jgi:hypothetical protein
MSKSSFVGSFFFLQHGVKLTAAWCMGGYGKVLDKVGKDSYLVECHNSGEDHKQRSVMSADVFERATIFVNAAAANKHNDARRKRAA